MEQKRFRVVFSPAAQQQMEDLETKDALQLARDIKSYLEPLPSPSGKPG